MIINYLKNIGYSIVFLLLTNIIITILNYFGLLNNNVLKILSILLVSFSMTLGGFFTGKKANKKGYLEGIKFGSILIIIFVMLNLLLFKNSFSLINILYYIILLFCSMLGSMIGIQKK